MHVLITGIAGFIGFHVAKILNENNFNIIGVDNLNDYYDVDLKVNRLKNLGIKEIKNDLSENFNEEKNILFIKGDICDIQFWNKVKKYNINIVIHLAAQAGVRYSLENPMSYIQSNILGFQNVIDFCETNKIKHFLYASSSSVYGKETNSPFRENFACVNPESLYAATKRSNELVAESYYKTKGFNSIALRFFTVYGPWGRPDMAPMLFASAAFSKIPIKVFNHGKQERDFTFIEDIVNAIFLLIKASLENKFTNGAKIINIGRGEPVNLMSFINEIENNLNVNLDKIFQDSQPGDVNVTYANVDKLYECIKYRPKVNTKVGVKLFCDWYVEYYNKSSII